MPQNLDGAASAAAVIAAAFSNFPALIADGIGAGGCVSGSAVRTCNDLGAPREIHTTFESCEVDAPSGKLVLDGSLTLSAITGMCPNILVEPITATVNLKMVYRDAQGATQRGVAANLTASISARRGLDSPCFSTGVTAIVNGTIQTQFGEDGENGGVDAELTGTVLVADVQAFNTACVPLADHQTFDGLVTFTDHPGGRLYEVELETYLVARTATAVDVQSEMTGAASGPCFGGGAMVTTPQTLHLPLAEVCPSDGAVHLESGGNPPRDLAYPDGQVEVDVDNDGTADVTYPSCLAAPACG